MDPTNTDDIDDESPAPTTSAQHSTKPYQCGYCRLTFTLGLDLVSHVEIHALTKPFQCALCNVSYESNPELTSHLTVHNLYLFVPAADNVEEAAGKLAQQIATASYTENIAASGDSSAVKKTKTFANQCTQTCAEVPEQQVAEPSWQRRSGRKRSQTFKLEAARIQAEKSSEDLTKESDGGRSRAKRGRPRKNNSDANSSFGFVKEIKVELEDVLESGGQQRHNESDGVTGEADDGSDEEYVPVRFGKGTDLTGVDSDETEVEEFGNDSDDEYVPASRRKRQKLADSEIEKSAENVQQKSSSRKGLQNLHQIQAKPKPSKLTFCRERQKKLGSHVRNAKLEKEKDLTCQDCGKSFNRVDILRIHRNTHLKVKPHQCKTCNKGFCSHSSLVTHQQRNDCASKMEDGVFPKQCNECNKTLKNKHDLKRHIKEVHWKIRKHICEVCNKGFCRMNELQMHRYSHTGTSPFHCEVCKKGLNSRQAYRAHVKRKSCSLSKTNLSSPEDEVFPKKCTECNLMLKNKSSYLRHTREVHKKIKNHICEVCSKAFYRLNDLHMHRFSHTDTKPFYCTNCEKGFNSRQAYYGHTKRNNCVAPNEKKPWPEEFTPVEGSFPGRCRQCDKSFPHRSALKKHVLEVHLKVKPHVCEYCAKAFSRVNDLKMHLNLHREAKPFSCESCETRFSSRQALHSHLKRNRCLLIVAARAAPPEINLEYTTVEGTFPGTCRQCGKTLASRKTLVKHVREVHLKIKRHKCDSCDRRFSRANELRAHRKAHTETDGKPVHCDVCQVGFDTQLAMKSHYNHIHGDKPFDCHYCGKNYSCSDTLRKHTAAKHPETFEAGAGNFDCPDCGRSFNKRQALKLHQKAKHSEEGLATEMGDPAQSDDSVLTSSMVGDPNHSAKFIDKGDPEPWKTITLQPSTSLMSNSKPEHDGMQVQQVYIQPESLPLYQGVGTVGEQMQLLQNLSHSIGTHENVQIIIQLKQPHI